MVGITSIHYTILLPFSVLSEHFHNKNPGVEVRGTCGVTWGFRSGRTETARRSKLKKTSFPGKWLSVSSHFSMFNVRLTLQSFSTLEIFHQVCPLAHFPAHLDSRLTNCQGYQELFGFQTYKKPVTKT